MLELPQRSQQMHNHQAKLLLDPIETQHSGFQSLANKMHARLTNANHEIDQVVFETFCKRVLAVTYQNWMCKP